MALREATGARSLRAQLFAWLAPPLLAVFALSTGISYFVAHRFAQHAFDAALFDSARALGQLVVVENGHLRVHLSPSARSLLESDPEDIVYFLVLDGDGHPILGNTELPRPPSLTASVSTPAFYDAVLADRSIRGAALAVADGDGRVIATVLYAETLRKRAHLAVALLAALLAPQVLLAIVGLTLVSFGVRRGLAPLERVTYAVAARGERDLSAVPNDGVPTEVLPLTIGINALLGRLRSALAAQQRFIADAAHQLRTPIAGLAAQTEHALAEHSPAAMEPALRQLRSSTQRATRLVNQLLTLARAEPGGDPRRDFHRLDLAKVVQEVCADWVPEALGQQVDLGYSGAKGPVFILGDEVLLGEMLGNLIDNAIRYGRRPGTVTARLAAAPRIELCVEDDGPGIPVGERERIFERFHRAPSCQGTGSGLGLAIVREIAHVHGARVVVEEASASGGASFRILFEGDRESATESRPTSVRGGSTSQPRGSLATDHPGFTSP